MLAWPTEDTDWSANLPAVHTLYQQLITQLLPYQSVILMVKPPYFAAVNQTLNAALYSAHDAGSGFPLKLVAIDYDDTWCRDTGPITCLHKASNATHTQIVWYNFEFNGWGNKHHHQRDTLIPQQLHHIPWIGAQIELRDMPWVLEGGSIESNGEHLLLSTTSCLMNPNRGPKRTLSEVTQQLRDCFAVEEVLWLTQGQLLGDDTDGHIDTLARFCSPSQLVYQSCDERTYPAYAGLKHMEFELQQHAKNHRLQLIPLPWPSPCYDRATGQHRLPASYANFLIANGQVIVPQYNQPQDNTALEILQQLFPTRQVVGLNCLPLIEQGGSLHCITMQLPKLLIPNP